MESCVLVLVAKIDISITVGHERSQEVTFERALLLLELSLHQRVKESVSMAIVDIHTVIEF